VLREAGVISEDDHRPYSPLQDLKALMEKR
jgi:hypothetical protein